MNIEKPMGMKIAGGPDSFVFAENAEATHSADHVTKVYNIKRNKAPIMAAEELDILEIEELEKLLVRYNLDTEMLASLVDQENRKGICYRIKNPEGEGELKIYVHVVRQGDVIKKEGDEIKVIGQTAMAGKNVSQLQQRSPYRNTVYKGAPIGNPKNQENITEAVADEIDKCWENEIQPDLNKLFTTKALLMPPYKDRPEIIPQIPNTGNTNMLVYERPNESGSYDLYVTDLCFDIRDTYENFIKNSK